MPTKRLRAHRQHNSIRRSNEIRGSSLAGESGIWLLDVGADASLIPIKGFRYYQEYFKDTSLMYLDMFL